MTSAPMLKAAGLWTKISAKGSRYLVGRMGGVKVLILENQDRDRGEIDPTHWLLFTEPAQRGDTPCECSDSGPPTRPSGTAARQRRVHPQRTQAGAPADPRPFDDIGRAP